MANDTLSPELMVLAVFSALASQALPPLDASIRAKCVTLPQPADGVGKLMAPLLLDAPPVQLDAAVLPADCVPDQLARLAANDARA